MAINTYATLVTAAGEWLARDNDATLVARVPDFITLCEAKLNRLVQHTAMEARSTAIVTLANDEPEFISLPSDFQTMRRIRISSETGKPRLEFMAQSQLEDYRYSIDNVTGQPIYYTIVGNEIELAPTPNEAYTLEMVYRANLSALTSNNTTNWLLTFAPDVYLYGVLLEAAAYIKDEAALSVWGAAFTSSLDQLNLHGHKRSVDVGPTTVWLPGVTP
jgi:hypothetical protein